MEYVGTAWCPWTEKDCETLEKVQKRAINMVSDLRGATYEERLKDVGLTSLRERRRRGDMIETFKIMTGLTNVRKEILFQTVTEDEREARSTRQNSQMNEDGEEYLDDFDEEQEMEFNE